MVFGNDIVLEYAYYTGEAPWNFWINVFITVDGRVIIKDRGGRTAESYCSEYVLDDKVRKKLIEEVTIGARRKIITRFEVNEKLLEKADPRLKEFVEQLKKAYS